jgi:hypothetical protein
MDHHVNVFPPINISLWMLLLLKYKGVLAKVNNIQKGLNLTIIENIQAPQQSEGLQCTSHSFLPP